jgi:hypothetical protein
MPQIRLAESASLAHISKRTRAAICTTKAVAELTAA